MINAQEIIDLSKTLPFINSTPALASDTPPPVLVSSQNYRMIDGEWVLQSSIQNANDDPSRGGTPSIVLQIQRQGENLSNNLRYLVMGDVPGSQITYSAFYQDDNLPEVFSNISFEYRDAENRVDSLVNYFVNPEGDWIVSSRRIHTYTDTYESMVNFFSDGTVGSADSTFYLGPDSTATVRYGRTMDGLVPSMFFISVNQRDENSSYFAQYARIQPPAGFDRNSFTAFQQEQRSWTVMEPYSRLAMIKQRSPMDADAGNAYTMRDSLVSENVVDRFNHDLVRYNISGPEPVMTLKQEIRTIDGPEGSYLVRQYMNMGGQEALTSVSEYFAMNEAMRDSSIAQNFNNGEVTSAMYSVGRYAERFPESIEELTLPGTPVMPVSIESDASVIPASITLSQNFPNPFNPSTSIRFELPSSDLVQLNIYDMLGRRVATLLNESMPAGMHTVSFDASGLASGTYIYRLTSSGGSNLTRMMTLIK